MNAYLSALLCVFHVNATNGKSTLFPNTSSNCYFQRYWAGTGHIGINKKRIK